VTELPFLSQEKFNIDVHSTYLASGDRCSRLVFITYGVIRDLIEMAFNTLVDG
jgi:hypothetical protein